MALITQRDGSLEIPDFAVAAATRHAEHTAELTGEFLRSIGICRGLHGGEVRSCGLSADVLLDLGALLQLQTWLRDGLCEFLPAGTPSFEDAQRAFVRQIHDVVAGKCRFVSQLYLVVLGVWMRSVAWDGQLELKADFVVGEVDEDALLDAVAELIWAHRHDRIDGSSKTTTVVQP